MKPDPTIGVIFERDAHPGAKRLADLTDPDSASLYLCEEHLPLSEALGRDWAADAHLILYTVLDEDESPAWARVNKRAPFVGELIQRGGRVDVPILVFDHDLPKVNGQKQTWTEEGLGEFVQGLAQSDLPSPSFWYTTLHGSRFIYVLDYPVSHLRAEALARALIARFSAAGVELDGQCSDWTRLFRLPRTARPDAPTPFHESALFMFLEGDRTLNPDAIPADEAAHEESFVEVASYAGDMPDPEMVRDLLVRRGQNGREYDSDWVKKARQYLQGRDPSYAVCFEEAMIDAAKHGGRNNALVKIAGQIVGMTARLDEASPEGIFALIYAAVEQLNADDQEGTDWHPVAWDIICRMWTNEQAQIEAENRAKEASLADARELRTHLIEQVRQERPADVPPDPEAAEEWFKRRMIASNGRQHYVMRRDGSYNLRPVSDSMLIPMIRELGMEDVIETHELRGKTWAMRSAQSILNDHATPITGIVCSARERVAYIDGEQGLRILHTPVHRLNPRLVAAYSQDVDDWLREFFGDKYDIGIDWLSHALEVAEPICALNLYGAPGTGKGMLAAGLAECFEGETLNDGRALGKFNVGLLTSPVVNCDEGLPQLKSDETLTIDQAFRALVTGGNITIRAMYENPYAARIYPRILFTGNDPDIIRSITGHRDLTDDDIRAIELRLLSIQVSAAANIFLTSRGNYAFTNGWIHGRQRSRYVLANHIFYLFQHRKAGTHSSGRLLVEGEVGTNLVRTMRLRSQSSQAILKTLVRMIESPQNQSGLHIADGRVWVTTSGVVDYMSKPLAGVDGTVSLPRAAQVLRQFTMLETTGRITKSRPFGAERGRWIELDLGIILEEATRYGMACGRVETLLRKQEGGAERAAAALMHLEAE